MSLLVICGTLRMFVNTSTAYYKYFLCNSENLQQPIQMGLSKKQTTFSQFFAPLLKTSLNFKCFLEKDDPHSLCISESRVCERLARPMSKKHHFRTSFDSQDVKGWETLVTPA